MSSELVSIESVTKLIYRYPSFYGMEKFSQGVPVIRGEHLGAYGGISQVWNDYWFVSAEYSSKHPKTVLEEDDVVMSVRGTVGTFARVGKTHVGAQISPNLIRLSPEPKKIYPPYFYYALRDVGVTAQLLGSVASSAVPALKASDIKIAKVRLPSMADQIGVAIALRSIDDRITLLRETNATLEAIAQALFKSWFVDFDPVRAKVEGLQPEGMDATTAALFPDSLEESELGSVPQGWVVEKLEGWLSVLETGRRPKGGVSGIVSGVPSIGAESIVRIGQFDYSKTKYVSDEFFGKMKSGALESNDVLLYKDGGKPGVFLPRVSMFGDGYPFEKCGINEHVFRIRIKEPFNQPFLYFWLWSDAVMHELKHRGGKAAIPGINQSDVKDQKISVPDAAVLHRFDELASPLVSKILANAKQAQTLTLLRDTLLPRLISGQLRLPEAEQAVEEALA